MIAFLLALGAFTAGHLLLPPLRPVIAARWGRAGYGALHGLVSLATLTWLIVAANAAPYVPLWDPRPELAAIPLIALVPACVLWVAGLRRPTPLSLGRPGGAGAPVPPVAALTRHPLLIGLLLWSGAHVPANGDGVGVILFGGLTLFTLWGLGRMDRRYQTRLGAARWARLAAGTAQCDLRRLGVLTPIDWLGGGLLYAGLLIAHPWVIGVDPLARFGG